MSFAPQIMCSFAVEGTGGSGMAELNSCSDLVFVVVFFIILSLQYLTESSNVIMIIIIITSLDSVKYCKLRIIMLMS